ncbi:hypothetical protein [Streptomyces sp. NPDC050121]|uniref:hypothetical protein n=1 Tax=Streptomyces sp. NPDC050121 TaxID=3365601 RepID=UPI003797D8E4
MAAGAGRLLSHLISVNVLDSATRLAAQTFLKAVPLLFVVASIAPPSLRDQLDTGIATATASGHERSAAAIHRPAGR